ncbi:MAG: ABC transporter ATP-binding protein [Deltaproteobacteria bacterium]|nr:ABC transporter ATP-binding protein [Deltaproteobacteria bacterium]MDQ3300267.1 ABC transporter ATP-binding protein [Myxococcota bacterium]
MTVVVDNCSKWYGHVLGVSDVSWQLRGGIVGLLGPNGAGKSTLIKMMAGLLRPSRGSLTVFGKSPFHDVAVRRRIGYAPEHEKTWDELTALELVTVMARLAGVAPHDARGAAERALAQMGMTDAMHRRVRGFSKGMRQRTKLATAIAHDPDFLLLDEPLTGVDPIARVDIVERIRKLAAAGKTVVVSSHVLYEIESLTSEIVVIYRGQVLAEGNVYEIRKLIDRHPHRIRVECDRPRDIAAELATADHVARIVFERGGVLIETRDPDRCYDALAQVVIDRGIVVSALSSPDNNLGAVFEYLTGESRGRA